MVAAALIGIMINHTNAPGTLPGGPTNLLPPMASQPYGEVRKFINYDDSRYAVIETLDKKDFDTNKLGDKLGMIQYNLMDENQDLEANFAGTFAIGGDIYALKSYNSKFRLAVVYNNQVYICENVDNINAKKMDLQEYFRTSRLIETTKNIEIYDHMGSTLLKTLDEKTSKELLTELSKSTFEEKTNAQFEEMGSAQAEGNSFSMSLILEDGSKTEMYVIPKLGLVSIGDNTYDMNTNAKNIILELTKDLKKITLPSL